MDIVKQLRFSARLWSPNGNPALREVADYCRSAADEIERLRARNNMLNVQNEILRQLNSSTIEECAKEAWRAWMEDANVYNAGAVICRAIRALAPQQSSKSEE